MPGGPFGVNIVSVISFWRTRHRVDMSRNAHAIAVAAVLLAAGLVLPGCSPQEAPRSSAAAESRLRVSGSGTCLPLLRILTAHYSRKGVDFAYLPGLHSGGGIQGVAGGELDLGAVSRELTAEESSLALRYTLLSRDGLVVAVHPSVGVTELTSKQVQGIYSGEYTNWKQLGGPDRSIIVLDRNEDESAKIILRRYVLGPDLDVTDRAVNLFYESDMVEAMQSTPGSVGYFSLGYGLSQNVPVRFLRLDGVEPSVANIVNGRYKVVRPLGVVTRSDAPEEVSAFVEWARGPEARKLIEASGFAPAGR